MIVALANEAFGPTSQERRASGQNVPVLRWWGVLVERAVGREGPKGRRMAAGKAGRFWRDPEAGNGTFVVCPRSGGLGQARDSQ